MLINNLNKNDKVIPKFNLKLNKNSQIKNKKLNNMFKKMGLFNRSKLSKKRRSSQNRKSHFQLSSNYKTKFNTKLFAKKSQRNLYATNNINAKLDNLNKIKYNLNISKNNLSITNNSSTNLNLIKNNLNVLKNNLSLELSEEKRINFNDREESFDDEFAQNNLNTTKNNSSLKLSEKKNTDFNYSDDELTEFVRQSLSDNKYSSDYFSDEQIDKSPDEVINEIKLDLSDDDLNEFCNIDLSDFNDSLRLFRELKDFVKFDKINNVSNDITFENIRSLNYSSDSNFSDSTFSYFHEEQLTKNEILNDKFIDIGKNKNSDENNNNNETHENLLNLVHNEKVSDEILFDKEQSVSEECSGDEEPIERIKLNQNLDLDKINHRKLEKKLKKKKKEHEFSFNEEFSSDEEFNDFKLSKKELRKRKKKLLKKKKKLKEKKNKSIKEPMPMKLRALPQSFWHEPNSTNDLSPASMFPISCIISGSRENCPSEESTYTEETVTEANVELLFSLFNKVEQDIKKLEGENKNPVVKRGRPKKPPPSLSKKMLSDEDPYIISEAADAILPLIPAEKTLTSLQDKIEKSEQELALVTMDEKHNFLQPILNMGQNYSQLLSQLVVQL